MEFHLWNYIYFCHFMCGQWCDKNDEIPWLQPAITVGHHTCEKFLILINFNFKILNYQKNIRAKISKGYDSCTAFLTVFQDSQDTRMKQDVLQLMLLRCLPGSTCVFYVPKAFAVNYCRPVCACGSAPQTRLPLVFFQLGPKGPADPSAECVSADKVLHTEEKCAGKAKMWVGRTQQEGRGGEGWEVLGRGALTGRVLCNQLRRQRQDDQRRSEAGKFSPRRLMVERETRPRWAEPFPTAVTFIFRLSKLRNVRLLTSLYFQVLVIL